MDSQQQRGATDVISNAIACNVNTSTCTEQAHLIVIINVVGILLIR